MSATATIPADAPNGHGERVMLLRERRSRIYFLRKFFDYPIQLSARTLRNLGVRVVKIGASYARNAMFPPKRIENFGAILHLALRRRALSHIFQVLHREGLGRGLRLSWIRKVAAKY